MFQIQTATCTRLINGKLPHTKCNRLKTDFHGGGPDNQMCSVSGFSVVVFHWPFRVSWLSHTANRSLWSKPSTI